MVKVIYGDTDSIMINTKTKDLKEVKLLGKQLKDKVNQSNIGRNNQKSKLEIEIDGIFETLLLLKKKKYAAKRIIERPDGSIIRMIDKKGLDLVRRDWCDLSKEMGEYVSLKDVVLYRSLFILLTLEILW
jgi:DNA polymerase alpha subunit A